MLFTEEMTVLILTYIGDLFLLMESHYLYHTVLNFDLVKLFKIFSTPSFSTSFFTQGRENSLNFFGYLLNIGGADRELYENLKYKPYGWLVPQCIW